MKSMMNPYLGFRNKTKKAMEFYHSVFGGKLNMQTFKEYNASQDPSEDKLIMHAQLEAENGMVLMCSDTPKHMKYRRGSNFSISLSGDNHEELSGYFNKLAVGGTITQPLTKAIWGDSFGMLIDKFGITWVVNITAPHEH